VTRIWLCAALCAGSVILALFTAMIQVENREHGLQLNALKEECSMLEAINGERAEQILAADHGPLTLAGEGAHVDVESKREARP
jgi:hypothetical protein